MSDHTWTRDDSWCRDKAYLGYRHPLSEKGDSGWERWPRFCAEVPPELAELLDQAHRKRLGVNASSFTRAGLVRAALRLYLDHTMPEPSTDPAPEYEADSTALEIMELTP